LDAPVDQTADNAEDGRMSGQLMAKSLRQDLEFVQLSHRMFNHNTIFGKKTIVRLLFFSQRMANCITGNVTLGSIVASGKMLLSDRQNNLSEEQHDEPEKQE
jgi:hypothetical protein